MKTIPFRSLILIGLLNLAIVALFGALMRYKIAFDFPLLPQKNAQQAHSHFAFAGWVSHMLFTLLFYYQYKFKPQIKTGPYLWMIALNLLASFGMLVSFTVSGYSPVSIVFSSVTIIVAIVLAYLFIKDSKNVTELKPSRPWLVTGLLLHIISSAGPLMLAYMIVNKDITEKMYLGSVYWLLHFEYNGWFFFGCMALAMLWIAKSNISLKREFAILLVCSLPTYFLSTLWAKLPQWLYLLTAISAFVQLFAWGMILQKLWKNRSNISLGWPKALQALLYIVMGALTIKFILQAISTQPHISQLVFGFRAIVIAYLHLVLLGVISLFLLLFLHTEKFVGTGKNAIKALWFFTIGVFLNEFILLIVGVASFAYFPVPYSNQALFIVALMLLGGALWMWGVQTRSAE